MKYTREEEAELSPQEKRKKTMSSKKRAAEVLNLWQQANSHYRVKWQINEQEAYDFVLNSQLSEAEEAELESAGMPTFIINRMTPVIETMKYFVTANNPRWKAIGTDQSDTDLGYIHTGVVDYCWYISTGKNVFAQAIFNALGKGKGYVHVYVDPDADRGLGEVMFESIDPFCVWTSPMCSDPFERDAVFQMIKKDLPREELKRLLPDYENVINRAHGEWSTTNYTDRSLESSDSIQPDEIKESWQPDGSEDDILPYFEVYEPMKIQFYNAYIQIPPPETELENLKEAIDEQIEQFRKELNVQFLEKELQLRTALENGDIIKQRYDLELERTAKQMEQAIEEQRSILNAKAQEEASKIEERVLTEEEYDALKNDESLLKAIPFYETRIKKTCVVGDKLLYEYTMNTSRMPLIAIPYFHTGTPFPMSAARPLVGKQREINKTHQIMVHSANIASNFRWKYVEGEIDEDTWENYVSAPNALLPYRPGYSPNGPEPIYPQPINNAFFTVGQESKTDLEYMAGIHPPSMGIGGGSDETFRGFLARDEFATRRIKSWVSTYVEPALEVIGHAFQELAQDTYTLHKVFRIVQPNPAGGIDENRFEVNVPIYDDFGKEIGRFNDYKSSRYDIRLIAGSTLPVNRWAILEEYKQYFELGVIDDIAFLMETDIKGKDAIIQRKSLLSQLQQQADQMQEALKDRDGTIETLERQLVQAGIKDQIREAGSEVDRSKTETKMIDKLVQERMRDRLKNIDKDIERLKQEAIREIEIAKGEKDGKASD
jgi:hypothetical protein